VREFLGIRIGLANLLCSALVDQVSPALLEQGLLYPLQANILETE
jgi:hypothetical protein